METKEFRKIIWQFYKRNKRDLPWRNTTDPYNILVSEIMLQQTQVPRVLIKYQEFITSFPDFPTLSKASAADILRVWQGLGYNRRALYLKKIAEKVVTEFNSSFPKDPKILETFPGIGKASARSIAVFSWNEPHVFIETNIRRTFIHHFFSSLSEPSSRAERGDLISKEIASSPASRQSGQASRNDGSRQVYTEPAERARTISDKELTPLIEQALDLKNPREWYYALMDYGSHLVKITSNPNRRSKHYSKQSKFEGSLRQVRGEILRRLLKGKEMNVEVLGKELNKQLFQEAFKQLEKEGFLAKKDGIIFLKS